MKVSFVRPTVSCMFYRCPMCNGESTIIGTTFYCYHCGCEIDDVFDDPYVEEKDERSEMKVKIAVEFLTEIDENNWSIKELTEKNYKFRGV